MNIVVRNFMITCVLGRKVFNLAGTSVYKVQALPPVADPQNTIIVFIE